MRSEKILASLRSNLVERRDFLSGTAAWAGASLVAGAGSVTEAFTPAAVRAEARNSAPSSSSTAPKVNPFKDPSYADGARQRMQELIGRGADPQATREIFAKLTSLDAEPWVAEWTKLAVPFEQKGAELESQGKMAEANQAYEKAAMYYGIARYPVLNHPAKQVAYRKCIENFRKAIRSWDPPLEIVEIPYEDKKIVGHLRKPKGATRPAVVIRTGGVDGYKEDRNLNETIAIGAAAFEVDMPGAGECPVFNKPDSEKLYIAVIDYLTSRQDLDGRRIGFIGGSYGGYWGAKMAYVEPKRLKACVEYGGPIHYTWQEPWLRSVLTEKEYFWPLTDSMVYANDVKDFDELVRTAPAMSLVEQGWLSKPNAPMLCVNGDKDPWISPQEIPLLLSTGLPKMARIMANAKHMGRGSEERGAVGNMVLEWVKEKLA